MHDPRRTYAASAPAEREAPPRQEAPADAWASWLARAAEARDFTALQKLAREAKPLAQRAGPPPGHTPVRVALLSGGSSQLLEGPLEVALLAAGLAPRLHVAPYDRIVPELAEEGSDTARFDPELAVVVNTTFNMPRWPQPGDSLERVRALAEEACLWFLEPCRRAHERNGCEVVLNTFAPPPARPYGNLGAKLPGERASFVRRVNVLLGDLAPDYVHLNDVAALVETLGLERFQDLKWWYHAKHPVAFEALPEYARNTAAIAAARFGRSRRCLVLDLDNTLWGGVIADDGLDGIRLGEGTAEGEAYKAFQLYLKELRRRGVVLAVCSKNEPAQARLPFEQHPECALKPEDFAAFAAGWGLKSEALRGIARELDLGLDALVFFDDNPAERAEVRSALPAVAVPEVPDEPAAFPRVLDEGRWFETVALSAEDLERTATYRRRAAAKELERSARTPEEFLASLEMRATVRAFRPVDLERVTQLVNKTNQFNLTTRRTTRREVEARMGDPRWLTRTVRLADRFGDHGLISVVCARIEPDALDIETWLMSCRVMQRGVERLLLDELVAVARALDLAELRGTYVPTERNEPVREHYPRLGFRPAGEEGGTTRWVLPLSDYRAPEDLPIARTAEEVA